MRIARYRITLNDLPVDFFADPDGDWDFDELVEAAGFQPTSPSVCVGALQSEFANHPAGAAVVAETGDGDRQQGYVAIIECATTAHESVSRGTSVTTHPGETQAA